MGTHPNTLLVLALTPDNLSRKTMRQILDKFNVEDDDDILIGNEKYHHEVSESDYLEYWQIATKEGDLLFFDLVTYGYGEIISWDKLEAQKNELEQWAKKICKEFLCSYQIFITANYW